MLAGFDGGVRDASAGGDRVDRRVRGELLRRTRERIVGGARGIGEAIARTFAQEGATLVLVDLEKTKPQLEAIVEAIEQPGAAPLALASISSIHWSDGGMLDMQRIREALRKQGAALLLDATHSVGVIATDVKTLDPDFLIFPTYKWVLGPYGRAFIYVAKRHQDGVPLEQTSFGRRNVKAENAVYFADARYLPDARRFDMGERDHFISMEMAAIGMEMMAAWGADAVVARLSALTQRIADELAGAKVRVPDKGVRAPHILSLGFAENPASVIATLADKQIFVATRLGRMRISPHVYNDENDVDRFVVALKDAIG